MADFFSLRPNFSDDLAELFCQELATLSDSSTCTMETERSLNDHYFITYFLKFQCTFDLWFMTYICIMYVVEHFCILQRNLLIFDKLPFFAKLVI
jgi:hypothetical protein